MVAAAAPVRPADVLAAPSSAATAAAFHYPPPRFDALVVEGSGAFPAASVPALTRMPMVFPRDSNAAVPAPARVGVHHSLAELSRRGVEAVTGELRCKRCGEVRLVTLDARARFADLHAYIACNVQDMDDRAPRRWKEPALPDCERCGQRGSMRPVIPADKPRINWVFLLLSEMLGVCTLEQLKHFCEHTHKHRTGAKDRVLYSTYMELCNQLLPNGLFDMESERRKRIRLNIA
ncbi:uncharacterized protein LOC120700650 [Panicum virgatum]|uniref:uncharacterized protein LOC120700650 n=1 Tax=Panicum virgatum TaxID=38727 RepID=UPI0019D513C9|nr:uncharacterized protein LOC120700650 [Panicum virgatum]